MPDWEKIEFTRRSLKRKETYNEFGKKVRFEPLTSIPKLRKTDKFVDDCESSRETLVWRENESSTDDTDEFVRLCHESGLSEEQALHIFQFNGFNKRLAKCDLEIYRPLVGMKRERARDTVNRIVDKIRTSISNNQNRDLNIIMMEFPAHTMGELLDFYANNRMSIKRRTAKYKSKMNDKYQNKVNEYLAHIDRSLCGSYLHSSLTDKCPDEPIDLTELLEPNIANLDQQLQRYSKRTDRLSENSLDTDMLATLLDNKSIDCGDTQVNDSDNVEIERRLDGLFEQLDEIEGWMSTTEDQEPAIRHKWDSLDISLLLMGLHQFGTDFDLVADAISTKTRAMVESFYLTFMDRYGLDRITRLKHAAADNSE